MRKGEGVPRWISPALIEEIRNALGKTKFKTGGRGGVHFVLCTVLFLSWEERLCALFTAALRIFGQVGVKQVSSPVLIEIWQSL